MQVTMEFEQVLQIFQHAISYHSQKVSLENINIDTIDEKLRSSLERKLKLYHKTDGKKYKDSQLTDFKQIHTIPLPASMIGRGLLGLFFNLGKSLRHQSLVVLQIGNIQEGAIVCYENPRTIRVETLPTDSDLDRYLFHKYFQDSFVQMIQNQSDQEIREKGCRDLRSYFNKKTIDELRKNLPGLFSNFMNNPIIDFTYVERMTFLGLLFDIARNQYGNDFNQIPVAACIKLAIDNEQSGKVYDIFDQSGTLRLSDRIQDRKQKVEALIKSIIPCNEDGTYDKELIQQHAEEIKKFFVG